MACRVAFIGLGTIGAPIAANMAKVASLTVFNRTSSKADDFVTKVAAAKKASTVEDAVKDADVVVTMLGDAASVEAAVPSAALQRMGQNNAIWLQMSTVGVEGCDRLAALASQHSIRFVDAPVAGTKKPAEDGMLKILVGCAPDNKTAVEKTCAPLFDAIGQATVWLGDVGKASRFKLVINTWVVGVLAMLGETLAIAKRLDVDPQAFLNAIKGGPLDIGYAQLKGPQMIAREYPTSFPLAMALKDARLILEATNNRKEAELKLMEAVVDEFAKADANGHGRKDMAAVFESVV